MKELLSQQKQTAAALGITQVKETARKNYGTVKPSGWPNNLPFYDQTSGFWIFYTGARWLTIHTEVIRFPRTAFAAPATDVTNMAVLPSDYAIYITRFEMYASLGATNNATNYWFYQLQRNIVDIAAGFSTSAGTAGSDQQLGSSPNIVVTIGGYLNVRVATALSPSPISVASMVRYRLVIP